MAYFFSFVNPRVYTTPADLLEGSLVAPISQVLKYIFPARSLSSPSCRGDVLANLVIDKPGARYLGTSAHHDGFIVTCKQEPRELRLHHSLSTASHCGHGQETLHGGLGNPPFSDFSTMLPIPNDDRVGKLGGRGAGGTVALLSLSKLSAPPFPPRAVLMPEIMHVSIRDTV